ncbi:DUF2716 domain-containing protein [Acidothermaceae bacterium B102]|nr:DUF2716 domain-containing protein [Acidothermaceae bacterium B102]
MRDRAAELGYGAGMSERDDSEAPEAWVAVDDAGYRTAWDAFDGRFGFRASTRPDGWPAIREPIPSVTFDLSAIPDGAMRGAAYDAINAEALRCFVWALPEAEALLVLDWQHPAYRFRPRAQAQRWDAKWLVPVFPDGDYYAFLTPDFDEGTFGHPWEKTLCVLGPRMVASLAASLATWLPVVRRNGQRTEPS